MNSDRIPNNNDDEAKKAFRDLFAAAASAKAQQDQFGHAAPAAMLRLARACYGHDNS